jgi:hypothetical protein
MDNETDQYNNRFRTTIDEILPLSFFKYISDEDFNSITKMDSIVNPGRYENYKNYSVEIKKDILNTRFSKEQINKLAKAFHFRRERLVFGLRYQIQLLQQGKELLALIEKKYSH